MTERVDEILMQFNSAKVEADLNRNVLEDAYKYSVPQKDNFSNLSPGQIKNARVYDTTAVDATITLTSKLHEALIPPFQNWIDFVAGEDVPAQFQDEINKNLKNVTDIFFRHLHNSNFDLAANEALTDLVVGTMALMVREGPDDNPLIFEAVPIESIAISEGPYGSIENVWREMSMVKAAHIKRIWPKATLTQSMNLRISQSKNVTFDFIESVIFREEENRFEYTVIERAGREIIFEQISESSPWVVARFNKKTGETWGWGPVLAALPTILSLEEMYLYTLTGAQLKVFPPLMAFSDGIFNPFTLNLQPNTIIPINMSSASTGGPIKVLEMGGDVNYGELRIQDFRDQINKLFYTEPLGPIDTPVRSATEVTIRQQALLEKIGPAFGRLQVEFIRKTVDRTVFILRSKGLIPNIKVDNKNIAISYRSPLGRSQDVQDITSARAAISDLQNIAGPEVAVAALNETIIPQWLFEKHGADPDLVKSPQELEEMKQKIAQAEQQRQIQQTQEVSNQ